ncbi:MAG: LacI family DNA-binding transcriptional regulator [Tetrasphaera sp.]
MSGTATAGTTIYDVARAAGVSIKTVSRVINGAKNVRPATAESVQNAIEALEYRPNAAARNLKAGLTDTIGVVVDRLQDPFFAEIVSVAESRAVAVGMDVLVAATGTDTHRARAQLSRLVNRGVAGLLITPFGVDDPVWQGIPRDRPVVLMDRRSGVEGVDLVCVDDEGASRTAIEHLISYGHQRIAFLGEPAKYSTVHNRLAGYLAALDAAGLSPDPALISRTCANADDALAVLTPMLDARRAPTAVFASTPLIAPGVVRLLMRSGRRDIALVVFGDFPMADLTTPPTTVIDQCPSSLAHAAMDRLLARVSDNDIVASDIVLPTRLIPRGSGELAPPRAARVRGRAQPRTGTRESSGTK